MADRGTGAPPQPMRDARRWLLADKAKVPHYIDGARRGGTLDGPADLVRLATLDDAVAALDRAGDGWTLGFALGHDPALGMSWQGVDFDHVLVDAEIVDPRWKALVGRFPGWAEFSRSLTGLHVIGLGRPFRALTWPAPREKGQPGIECYSAARFFAITAMTFRDGGLDDLHDAVAALRGELAERIDARRPTVAAPPRDPQSTNATTNNISDYCATHPIEAALLDHGYERHGRRWLSPRSTSGLPGVTILDDQRAVSWHASDAGLGSPVADGQAVVFDAFDLAVHRDFRGDRRRACRELLADRPRPERVQAGEVEVEEAAASPSTVALEDFYAYMPMHAYIFAPTRDLWPATSVNGRIHQWPTSPDTGKPMRPSDWLDRFRPVDQTTWGPDEPMIVRDRVVAAGGWVATPGAAVFNLYRPAEPVAGDPTKAGRWRDHLRHIYPAEADHIEQWLAHRIQRPGEKINHALVLGGVPGIGKDTLLEPVKRAVGPWNWEEVTPVAMMGRFNGWCKAVVVRVSEARDQGEFDRFKFYDHSKVYIAAPPDVIRVDEKNIREHPVMNVAGVIITTNHRTDGIYLPADDRRHFVAWSDAKMADFAASFWTGLWQWYESGGFGHVASFLRTLDLSGFNPKAPPAKTEAFWSIVAAGQDPEAGELHDVIERAGSPDAVTLDAIISIAGNLSMYDLVNGLKDRRALKAAVHKLERAGYTAVRNPDNEQGLWRVGGRRVAIYGRANQSAAARLTAARALARQ